MDRYIHQPEPICRACQGDIYSEIRVTQSPKSLAEKEGEEIEVTEISYNYAIVLTQECDLEQDFKNRQSRKNMISISRQFC